MKTLFAVAVMALVCFVSAFSRAEAGEAARKRPKPKAQQASPSGKLRHVVLLAFKEGTSPEDIKRVEEGFRALPSKIPTIVDFEWGTNNSPEGLADGFTHCFLVTFDDAEGRAVYLPHEAHQQFVSILRPHLEKVLVIDYVAKD